MTRWLVLVLGVGIAAAALTALVGDRPRASAPAAHAPIDAASRQQLEKVLERSGAGGERGR